ncbi:hypothetical protein MMC30_009376 [Trapelia coarctata]|nr:hypothetical protein [Trapelia coarctata]
MDRALDEVIGERHTNGRADTNIDTDWLHDKYEDDAEGTLSTVMQRELELTDDQRDGQLVGPEIDDSQNNKRPIQTRKPTRTAQLRVDNLHYDLTEEELDDLFNRIAPVQSLNLRYDRAGRSTGTAYVSYSNVADAREAIREFDGANANGQPIRLTLLPTGPSAPLASKPRNPFDTAVKPGRSLFDRIEEPRGGRDRGRDRDRSRSPGAPRRTDTRKPPPEGVDRYIPGEDREEGNGARLSRSRSPIRREMRNDSRRDRGRDRDGRERGGRGRGRGESGRLLVNGRERKTQEELDREMEDYWHAKDASNGAANAEPIVAAVAFPSTTSAALEDGDIDMIE